MSPPSVPQRLAFQASLVRACVGRYLLDTVGEEAARAHEQEQARLGFLWVGDLARLLVSSEHERTRYPDPDGFMPRVVAFFESWVANHPAPSGQAAP